MAALAPQLDERITEFKTKLDERLKERKQGIRSNPSVFTWLFDQIFAHPETAANKDSTLTWAGKYTLNDKEKVIEKIKNELDGKNVIYIEKDIDAARDGDTGKLLAQYEDVLPAKFKELERIMERASDRRIADREVTLRR